MHHFNWTPTIGDPTFVGWLTVGLYFITAWHSGVLARAMYHDNRASPREFVAWTTITVLFIALGINKQLDLQSALTEFGRVLFYRPDRIAYKHAAQLWFIAAFAVMSAIAAIAILSIMWKTPVGTRIGALGTVLVICYVLIRAASFHHVDAFIGSRVLSLKWNWVLEIGGILTVLLGTYIRGRAQAPHKTLVTGRT